MKKLVILHDFETKTVLEIRFLIFGHEIMKADPPYVVVTFPQHRKNPPEPNNVSMADWKFKTIFEAIDKFNEIVKEASSGTRNEG